MRLNSSTAIFRPEGSEGPTPCNSSRPRARPPAPARAPAPAPLPACARPHARPRPRRVHARTHECASVCLCVSLRVCALSFARFLAGEQANLASRNQKGTAENCARPSGENSSQAFIPFASCRSRVLLLLVCFVVAKSCERTGKTKPWWSCFVSCLSTAL